ncbi:MAG: thioredoxin family protein [Bradymonadia bacterium]
MALTPSTMMLSPGTPAPDFSLPETTTGDQVSLSDYAGRPLLVMFICNHCPFVVHLEAALAKLGHDYAETTLGIVAISANSIESHPQDGPTKMAEKKASAGYVFPYLYDESQEVAKAYTAACTPDFFVFDASHALVYRGQFDETRPGKGTAHGGDLRAALDAVLAGQPALDNQLPSIGCNIKWKPGNAPSYFG